MTDSRQLIVDRIKDLRPGDQKCMALRFEHNLRVPEIAASLGWNEAEVRASLNRSIKTVMPSLDLSERNHVARRQPRLNPVPLMLNGKPVP